MSTTISDTASYQEERDTSNVSDAHVMGYDEDGLASVLAGPVRPVRPKGGGKAKKSDRQRIPPQAAGDG